MKLIVSIILLFCAAAMHITLCKNDDVDPSPNNADKDFMTKATFANRDEIDFAQVALQMSINDLSRA